METKNKIEQDALSKELKACYNRIEQIRTRMREIALNDAIAEFQKNIGQKVEISSREMKYDKVGNSHELVVDLIYATLQQMRDGGRVVLGNDRSYYRIIFENVSSRPDDFDEFEIREITKTAYDWNSYILDIDAKMQVLPMENNGHWEQIKEFWSFS